MITKLLNEVNEKIEILNNLVQDKEYFEKIEERIEKVNKYVQEQKQEIERLHSIIKEAREYIENKQELNKMFGTITLSKDSQKELLEILNKENKCK